MNGLRFRKILKPLQILYFLNTRKWYTTQFLLTRAFSRQRIKKVIYRGYPVLPMLLRRLHLIVFLTLVIFILFSNSYVFYFQVSAFSDFNFDTVGDWGCNSNTQSTENNIKGKSPESVLALGDYSYQPTVTCWLNIINPTKSITSINIGNHENDASEDNSKYMSQFGLTKQYYSFDYQRETGGPKVNVLTMATELSISKGSSQYNFVLSDLQKASTDPTIKWIIVNYHRVMYHIT